MNDDKTLYNIEDTARLMTRSRGPKRKLMVLLIVIALLAVLAIGIVGIRSVKEKRYNKQIEIAEKALIEGDYKLAESEYLSAVSMNKRKPKAREGLAYTYAIQTETEKSVKIYNKLYEDTKEEKYQEAAQEVKEGRLPTDPTIAPALGKWRHISLEQITYYPTLQLYLHYLNQEYYFGDETREFTSDNPGDFPALSILMAGYGSYDVSAEDRMLYVEGKYEEYEKAAEAAGLAERVEIAKTKDPRGWSSEEGLYDYYEIYDIEKTNSMIKFLFNISDEDIQRVFKQAEEHKQMYSEDGKYYCVSGWPTGAPVKSVEVTDVWTDGNKYCIQCDFGRFNDEYTIFRNEEYTTRYATLELKKNEGKHYWSLYYLGREKPKDIPDNKVTDEDTRTESINGKIAEWDALGELSADDNYAFTDFMGRYLNFSGPTEFDSRNAGDSIILRKITGDTSFIDLNLYPVDFGLITEHADPDPRGWEDKDWHKFISGGRDGYFYSSMNADAVEWIAKTIFNISDKDLAAMLKNGEDNKLFYKEGDLYYYVSGMRTGVGVAPDLSIQSVKIIGNYYYIEFHSSYIHTSDSSKENVDMYTLMQVKEIDGSRYWTLHYLSESPLSDAGGFVSK